METNNVIRQKDLEIIANSEIMEHFRNKTILVTGATGLIGSELILAFLCANRLKDLNINVIGLVRNKEKAENVYKYVLNNPKLDFIIQDISEPIKYEKNVDYVIHTAGVTASGEMITNPTKCIFTTINGTKNVLDFANQKQIKSLCYLSSIEIYGTKTVNDVKENDYGILDSLNVRSCYSISKKLAENLCVSYLKEYGTNVKIARLTQTFGAGISSSENRVFAQFANSIVKQEDIVLHTDGSSSKNYCYITDSITAILTILIKGETGEAYNIANYNSYISIKNLAEMLIEKYKTSKLIFDIDKTKGYAPAIAIKLNPEKLERLGWKAIVGTEEMFDRLIESLKE